MELRDGPITERMALGKLNTAGCGSTVLFTGRVRPSENGRRIDSLYYECYRSMAEKLISEILENAIRRYRLSDAAVIHRIGSVGAGELSIVVAVSSVRRREGFRACAGIVKSIKEKVPIWKKEIGEVEEWQSERVQEPKHRW
ncbi:MAG: molybdenum cofactor biosynthesis protein MoaE [Candidatus Thermoplasmatota archaeon]|nr:molybdenum cofactor biosynthesis protein MoaE [Candidatus Sysuiplasma jiujiangense]MBX8639254.1 molybdenum cofactor biosynthesis protein MoaE [Candidatus Sysuiplasma jiujiangense]MBX8641504.1 molybdenum cofactor biosynthesis protein MoaE [Candidatus Sysuiplasma jiujiangense]MCL4317022.1 molybdenum cofactor biosynthesis protein MoaE [Candidatus Thermoplasmatota archaeon]MCL5253112.1 molybdenum cofactor biosynthesis protein MoaE [Candidatus Thermoplasmatota archaeon]